MGPPRIGIGRYQEHLQNCVGLELVPDAQHAPALENPAYVADAIIRFATSREAPAKVAQVA